MITLRPIDETNFIQAARLKVHPVQQAYLQSAPMILAMAYAYRNQRGVVWGIYLDDAIVGLAMLHDLEDEPSCYHLCQFLIDAAEQGKGYGQQALQLILSSCRREGKFPRVEVCVKKEDAVAIHVYEKAGFYNTGYIDPETPDCLSLVFDLHKEIHYRDIVLRDMVESDIADWVRWQTVQTEWMDWDGPDLESDPFDEQAFRAKCDEELKSPMKAFRNFFELAIKDGKHIGMVSSYATDENYQHLSWAQAHSADHFWFTLGICICESEDWSRGLGTQALAAFCKHFLDHGKKELRLQTWSGNLRMVRCAERIGFRECNRFVGNRHIRGGVYDGLTFQLDEGAFRAYLAENP